MWSSLTKIALHTNKAILSNITPNKNVQLVQYAFMNFRASDLWKSVTSVSAAGKKKGRGNRRGASLGKDLNL